MFTLAHFSDPHFGPLPRPRVSELMSQRILGYLSWHRRRKHIHDPRVLSVLADDIRGRSPDHVAITGDLANISLPAEFEQIRSWLDGFGAADWISVIPGNHDAYVTMPWDASLGRWADFFTTDERGGDGGAPFPFVRRRGNVAIVGVNTACPTLPTFASGRVGAPQLQALGAQLARLAHEGAFRVVLLHHPPQVGGASWRKHLSDAAAFRECIAAHGAELILHGHNHKFVRAEIAGPQAPVPVIGVPSASAARAGHKPQSHYNLYQIAAQNGGWRIDIETRGLAEDRRSYRTTATESLTVVGAAHG